VTIPLRSGGGRGTYLVSYRVVSADSHPVAGSITYSVGAASTPPSEQAGAESVDPVVRALIPVGKYLGYAGLVLLVGPVLVLALLWPHRLSRVGPARLGRTSSAARSARSCSSASAWSSPRRSCCAPC
jgi:copper transport protein